MAAVRHTRAYRSDYCYATEEAIEVVKHAAEYDLGFEPDHVSMESKRLKDGTKIWRVVAFKLAKKVKDAGA